ncbi:GH3 auxin-responsive promoter family protein, partial [bacterium]|nr:GH3 auxin-responsive promoter family protein [bacterium]
FHYEPTSGSSGGKKLIPYNRPLLTAFGDLLALWCADLEQNGPNLKWGCIYTSISPAFHEGEFHGLEDDREYLPWLVRKALGKRFLTSPTLKKAKTTEEYYHALATLLLAEPELEVLSFWNPSVLLVLVDYIREHKADFKISSDSPQEWWPELKWVSCWGSGWAENAFRTTQELFPRSLVQAKGLLATEAPLTFPSIAAQGFLPLVDSVFYEFEAEDGRMLRLDALDVGKTYEIVFSHLGGLYRYRLGDRVKVTHFYKATPCLEFVGRTQATCDLVGEKLEESFVQGCLDRLAPKAFSVLVPDTSGKTPYYHLLTESSVSAEAWDATLSEAYHYRQARKLNQLGPCRVTQVARLNQQYQDYFVSQGIKLGDLKHRSLLGRSQDASHFLGLV